MRTPDTTQLILYTETGQLHREMVVSEDIQGQHAGVLDSITMEEIQTETSELSRSVQM